MRRSACQISSALVSVGPRRGEEEESRLPGERELEPMGNAFPHEARTFVAG